MLWRNTSFYFSITSRIFLLVLLPPSCSDGGMEQLLASFISTFSALVMILSILSDPSVHLFCKLVLVCVTVLRVETVLLETLGVFSVNFPVWLYSSGDATENWAATSARSVSCSLKTSFSVIDSSDPISACGKLNSFFLYALLCVYQYWNTFAFQYHESLFPAGFQLYWKKVLPWKTRKLCQLAVGALCWMSFGHAYFGCLGESPSDILPLWKLPPLLCPVFQPPLYLWENIPLCPMAAQFL